MKIVTIQKSVNDLYFEKEFKMLQVLTAYGVRIKERDCHKYSIGCSTFSE